MNPSESEENLTHKRPDMVFANSATLCFVENKVESAENENQLYLYYSILKNEESDRKKYLRYCTKYYDPKNSQDYGGEDIFKQFRWSDVSKFLSDNENENPLIREFILFLRSFGMGKIEKFIKEDSDSMVNLFSLIEKMQKMCELILPNFERFFGEIPKKSWSDQILFRNRYGITSKYGILRKNSSVFVGFDFDKYHNINVPILQVLLWLKSDKRKTDFSIIELAQKEGFIIYDWRTDGIGVSIEAPLSNFITQKNQEIEINKWFELKIEMLHNFINKTINQILNN